MVLQSIVEKCIIGMTLEDSDSNPLVDIASKVHFHPLPEEK
jgi:hypothetical protein